MIAAACSKTNDQNHTLVLFRSAAVSGWSVLVNRSDSRGAHFHSQDIYTWSQNQLVTAKEMPPQPSSNQQQLIHGRGESPASLLAGKQLTQRWAMIATCSSENILPEWCP